MAKMRFSVLSVFVLVAAVGSAQAQTQVPVPAKKAVEISKQAVNELAAQPVTDAVQPLVNPEALKQAEAAQAKIVAAPRKNKAVRAPKRKNAGR